MMPGNSNFSLSGYRLLEQIYSGTKTVVYRAMPTHDVAPESSPTVIIKLLSIDYPRTQDLLRFRHQYTITKNLNHPGIIQPYGLVEYARGYALVMADVGGIALDQYLQNHSLSLSDILALAIQVTDILHMLCQQQIIHKDIKPANLLIHPITQQIWLIDFSIASLLPRETPAIFNPNGLEGTLAYLAPEQTGRMNRGIDYRSDFYALGVTLYQLLTGQLPFSADEAIDLIHCHLAIQPVLAHHINPDVPIVVSQIVAKLMAKNAEDRYQSALGLKYDLEQCLIKAQATGMITAFPLGQRDQSDRFVIPEKLYGRETEVKTLLDAFHRVAVGGEGKYSNCAEMILIAGFSGIGKSAIVSEVHKPIVRQRGYFSKGKFDQFHRNIPFSAFVQAFRDLLGQLLAESDQQLQDWKREILVALGDNAQVMIDVMPELERIVGAQHPVPELSGTVAQNRFNLLFQNFIQVFTKPDHPLVIFLDDLQWADSASLKLMLLLMGELRSGYLLLIGAYRDNEVFPAHPLMLTLEEVGKVGGILDTITLQPLSQTSLNQLVADTLHCRDEWVQPLSELVYQKTQGNPFFATQFLKALYQDRLITFDAQGGYWQCDITPVRAAALTNDVVALMMQQLQKLPLATQNVLKLAACIGNQFDLSTLAIGCEQSEFMVADALWQALQAGLVVPQSEVYKFYVGQDEPLVSPTSPVTAQTVAYRFLHDRVQQAAYALIPESQKPSAHLKIGQLLLRQTPAPAAAAQIFEIVGHLNLGAALMDEPSQRDQLAQLNLLAGRHAKATTAYGAATTYLRAGIKLLRLDSWQTQYDLTLALYTSAAEAAYLNTQFVQMEQLVSIALARSETLMDRVSLYHIQILAVMMQGLMSEAVEGSLQILQDLGLSFPDHPTVIEVEQELKKTSARLETKPIAALIDLPEMSDPLKLAALKIMNTISPAAHAVSPIMHKLMNLKAVNLLLDHGNCPDAAHTYAIYGLVLCGVIGDIEAGYEMGQLALRLLAKFNAKVFQAATYYVVSHFIMHWKEPARNTLKPMLEGYTSALETGYFEFAGHCAYSYCHYAYCCGVELQQLSQEMAAYNDVLKKYQLTNLLWRGEIFHQAVLNLLGTGEQLSELKGTAYNEAEMMPIHLDGNDGTTLFYIFWNKCILAYLAEDMQKAAEYSATAEQYLFAGVGMLFTPIFHFYDSLIQLSSAPGDRPQQLTKVQENQAKLERWAQDAPMNHLHKYHLVAAEQCRILDQKLEAMTLYDQAIAGAQAHGYLQEEALANELAAKFYLAWGKEKIATTYMQEAYYGYARWGATAKTDDLERRYPQLLVAILKAQQSASNSLATLATITQSLTIENSQHAAIHSLDLVAAIQAAQALSSIIELPLLIDQLRQILLENSGAEICTLLLASPHPTAVVGCVNQDVWQVYDIVATSSMEKAGAIGQTLNLNCLFLEDCRDLPHTLINQVRHSHQTMILDSRTGNPLYYGDDYLQCYQPRSVMCLPLLNRGKLQGLVYLENRTTADVFTADRQVFLEFIAAQAVITLHNAQLYESVAQRSAAIEASGNGIAILENDRFVYMNQSHAEMFGYTVPELLGQTWQCLHSPDQVAVLQAEFSPALSAHSQCRGEAIATRKDGSIFDEELSLSLLPTGQMICICSDISDRKTTERKLRFTQFALDNSADGITLLRPDGSFAYVNKSLCHMLGYSPAELATMHVWDIDDETSPHTWPNHWRKLRAAGGFSVEVYHQSKDGKRFPVDISLNYYEFANEEFSFARVRDVSNAKAAELALRQSEERYQKLSQNIPGAIYEFRLAPDGQISVPFISAGCQELFHLSPIEVMADATCVLQMIHPHDVLGFQEIIAASAQNMTAMLWEGRVVLNSGEVKWIKSVSRPEAQPDGSIVWDGVLLDITEQQEALRDRHQAQIDLLLTNERLELTVQELQRATRLKDEFLATMSHELRTPLNAILAMSEALQEEVFGVLNSRQINSLAAIEQSGQHLLSLINDILDVSKIAAGKLVLNMSQVALSELCQSSLMLVKQQADEKQIQIKIHLPAELDTIRVDERRMRQVLINLLGNGVKFTPSGGTVTLFVRVDRLDPRPVSHPPAEYSVRFSVIDTGIGIAKVDQHKLFQPFMQVDSNLNRKYEGTGLGLMLVKQIVELHGGYVTLDSELGQGSCFSVMLPQTDLLLAKGEMASVSNAITTQIDTFPLILLAEKNEVSLNTFSSYLRAKGYRIILAQNGREAIALTQNHRPDLILMDIQLSDMDGMEVIQSLSHQLETAQIPIIALTVSSVPGDREKYIAVGAHKYLTKPVKLQELHHTIQKCLDLNQRLTSLGK